MKISEPYESHSRELGAKNYSLGAKKEVDVHMRRAGEWVFQAAPLL